MSVPAKIESIDGEIAIVDVKGVKVKASLQLVENAAIGDYVLVHTGFALQILSPEEVQDAKENLRLLENERLS